MIVKKSNKMVQLKRDKFDGKITVEGFYYSDDLFFNDLYIFIDANDDIYLIDANQGKVYDLPYYSYTSRNVLLDCANDLNEGKTLKCVRLKRLEKEVLNKYGKED